MLCTIQKRFVSISTRIASLSLVQNLRSGGIPARLAGRRSLPGANEIDNAYPAFLAQPRVNFPVIYTPSRKEDLGAGDPVLNWVSVARDLLDTNLPRYGAIILRGLPIDSPHAFSKFMCELGYQFMTYEGGTAVRQSVEKNVFTASGHPPSVCIEPHNEMAYSHRFPSKIFLFCEIPPLPGCGGESVVVDIRDIKSKLSHDLLDKFRRLKVRYYHHFPSGDPGAHSSWQQVFSTGNKHDVESFLTKHNYDFEWTQNDSLLYSHVIPAFICHPTTGEELWFNQIHLHHATFFKCHPKWIDAQLTNLEYPLHSCYGNGEEFEPDTLQKVRNAIWQVAVGLQLKRGDILVTDNVTVQHGRLGFTGQRRLLVSITKD
ncbi:dapdiamide synthesis protein DdaC-like [Saccoglossus kowalevskii]|uniref:Clavaminate synthase-like protein At3g21360-like n=1 Tax=Saccoglossus kowalevskii TaxID=10224 RepID=A0ABM0GRA3_SACKO|nr:PREDICTED: clavaminate synthase-like protein At3g21360-like [Saccoglossus kowalevskii]